MNPCIIIPATDCREHNKEDLESLLYDIEKNKDEFTTLVLMDSVAYDFLLYFKSKFAWINIITHNNKAFNFTKNSNIGLRYCLEKQLDAILINQDCRILSPIHLKELKGRGISSAQSVNNKLISTNLGDLSRQTIIGHFPFYCTYFPIHVLQKVGVMDEVFIKTHSDNDYCLRVLLANLPVEVVNFNIHHKGSHIDVSKEDWESHSGCYNGRDLAVSSYQYRMKWSCLDKKDEEVIPWVLKNYVWEEKFCCK